jgi:hypothetical protein
MKKLILIALFPALVACSKEDVKPEDKTSAYVYRPTESDTIKIERKQNRHELE